MSDGDVAVTGVKLKVVVETGLVRREILRESVASRLNLDSDRGGMCRL